MDNIHNIKMEILKIREAINSMEVKGEKNASLIVYAFRKCNDVVDMIDSSADCQDSGQNGNNMQEKEAAIDHGK